jgi:hypothetical protein
MRLWVHGKFFFLNKDARWNMFDLLLVLLSLVDCASSWIARAEHSPGVSATQIRALRILKFGRVIRAFRAVKFLEQLRLMLELCMTSLGCVFWTLVMITIVVFAASLFFVQGVVSFLQTAADPLEELKALAHFDSLQTTAVTCLQAATGGMDWGEAYENLGLIGPEFQLVFVVYILFFVLILLNIVTSVFLDKVMKFAEPSAEALIEEKTWMEENDFGQLQGILSQVDEDGSGKVNMNEFRSALQTPKFGALLASRGIDINEATAFFEIILAQSDGKDIDVMELAKACLRMQGHASNVDLQILRHEVKMRQHKMLHDIRKLRDLLEPHSIRHH